MRLLDDPTLAVEREILSDAIERGGAEIVVDDDRAAAVFDGAYKCVLSDVADFSEYASIFKPDKRLYLMNMPLDAPKKIGFAAEAKKSFAYLGRELPTVGTRADIDVRRLAPTLADTVLGLCRRRTSAEELRSSMRDRGMFGALCGGELVGFIGRRRDGAMDMLTVLDGHRGRGVEEELEKDMIAFIMFEGRLPVYDVPADDVSTCALQNKLGMTAALGYTFSIDRS